MGFQLRAFEPDDPLTKLAVKFYANSESGEPRVNFRIRLCELRN